MPGKFQYAQIRMGGKILLIEEEILILSRVMRKPVFEFPTSYNTNQAVQTQKMVSGLKFWIYEEEGLNYLCSENKVADAKIMFSHDAAHFLECFSFTAENKKHDNLDYIK